MTDYLYIDTTRARTAAQALRAVSAAGVDHASTIARACRLADLANDSGGRLTDVAEALAELATVLEERSDAADCSGLLPYQSRSMALGDLTMLLYGATPPTPGELFPVIGPPTNRPTFAGAVGNGSGSIGGIEPAQSDRRLTPIIPWFDDVLDDPFLSPSTWSDIALEPWRMVADGVADALPSIDRDDIDLFIERVQAATDVERMMRGETLPGGIPVIAAEVLAQYGILSVGILGGGLSYTRAGDGELRLGLSVPLNPPTSYLPYATFTPTNEVPEDGVSLQIMACDWVCGGGNIDENGKVSTVIGAGPLGLDVSLSDTRWWKPFGD